MFNGNDKRTRLIFCWNTRDKKEMFTDTYLNGLSGSKQFCWNWLPSKGAAGGILLGVNIDMFEVGDWVIKNFSISCELVNKKDGFKSRICIVYGASSDDKREEFIDELHRLIDEIKVPVIIGGDFNLVRYKKDKSNGCVYFKWCDKFNEWIDKYGLLEIKLFGRSFTCSNNQENVVMSHIDRIFCNTDFDTKFPLGWVKALTRNPSDHVPLLWEAGQNQPKKVFRFKFEKW
jgi:hypothetical protein